MRLLGIVILSVLLWSCKEKKATLTVDENNGDPVYNLASDDKEMSNAIEKAKTTYPDFLNAFKQQDTANSDFTIKMRFSYDDGNGEHMWVNGLFLKGDQLFGVLASDPVNVKNVKYGDTIQVVKDNLSDWTYMKNNKMVGGYTMKVLYDRMSESEKADFRTETGILFE